MAIMGIIQNHYTADQFNEFSPKHKIYAFSEL